MELRHLRYFTAVAEHLNFSEASRRIHVAQPSISQTVLDLEDELGVRLLFRDRRTVRLTAAGHPLTQNLADDGTVSIKRLSAERFVLLARQAAPELYDEKLSRTRAKPGWRRSVH